MSLHEEYDEHSFSDFKYDEDMDDLSHKKQIKRRLEEQLERKRFKKELQDDFDEYNADFDWDEINK